MSRANKAQKSTYSQSADGLGWIGSHKMEPRTTLYTVPVGRRSVVGGSSPRRPVLPSRPCCWTLVCGLRRRSSSASVDVAAARRVGDSWPRTVPEGRRSAACVPAAHPSRPLRRRRDVVGNCFQPRRTTRRRRRRRRSRHNRRHKYRRQTDPTLVAVSPSSSSTARTRTRRGFLLPVRPRILCPTQTHHSNARPMATNSASFALSNTHPFNGPFPGLPRWAGTRKVKSVWILLKQETVSGSDISWAICKSAPCSRQITTPTPHHSVFYRPDALPATQPRASKHWRILTITTQSTQLQMKYCMGNYTVTATPITSVCMLVNPSDIFAQPT